MNISNAISLFETICRILEEKGFAPEKGKEGLSVRFRRMGIPGDVCFSVGQDDFVVSLTVKLPIDVKSDKMLEMTVASCIFSNRIPDGKFYFRPDSRKIVYSISELGYKNEFNEKILDYMIESTVKAIAMQYSNFQRLNRGDLSIFDIMSDPG